MSQTSRPAALAAALFVVAPTVLLVLAPAPAAAEVAPAASNLTGVWREGLDLIFRILQVPGDGSLTTEVLNDTCTSGPREYTITATITGVALEGTMQRCDDADSVLVTKCNTSALWETPFWANVTDGRIVGERRGEYWTWDTDAGGNYTNCTIDHYTMNSFEYERMDCAVKTFEELAEHHIADPSKRDAAIQLAQSFEDGQKLYWTEGQSAPGGLKEHVTVLQQALAHWNYTTNVNSAYRPILYQGHFADLRICGLALRSALIARPYLAPYFGESVAAVNAEVDKHSIKYKTYTVEGLSIHVPFVCWKEPLTNCPHTDERAADLSLSPDDARADWIGSLVGMCRPYLFASTPDRPHWEYLGPSPFSTPKCAANRWQGTISLSISGNSPVNLMLTDPNGQRLGYDPATGGEVDDFGGDSYYSGAGSHPQLIELDASQVVAGNYTVTGVGTGDGDYTVDYSLTGDDGYGVGEGNVTGHASANASTTTLRFSVPDDAQEPSPWEAGTLASASGGALSYTIHHGSGTQTVVASGGAFTGAMYDPGGLVLAVGDDGAAGATRITVPEGLLQGEFTVRSDGVILAFTKEAAAGGATLVFDRPAGGHVLTVEATQAGTGASSPPPHDEVGFPWLVVGVVGAVAAGAVVVLWMRKRAAPRP